MWRQLEQELGDDYDNYIEENNSEHDTEHQKINSTFREVSPPPLPISRTQNNNSNNNVNNKNSNTDSHNNKNNVTVKVFNIPKSQALKNTVQELISSTIRDEVRTSTPMRSKAISRPPPAPSNNLEGRRKTQFGRIGTNNSQVQSFLEDDFEDDIPERVIQSQALAASQNVLLNDSNAPTPKILSPPPQQNVFEGAVSSAPLHCANEKRKHEKRHRKNKRRGSYLDYLAPSNEDSTKTKKKQKREHHLTPSENDDASDIGSEAFSIYSSSPSYSSASSSRASSVLSETESLKKRKRYATEHPQKISSPPSSQLSYEDARTMQKEQLEELDLLPENLPHKRSKQIPASSQHQRTNKNTLETNNKNNSNNQFTRPTTEYQIPNASLISRCLQELGTCDKHHHLEGERDPEESAFFSPENNALRKLKIARKKEERRKSFSVRSYDSYSSDASSNRRGRNNGFNSSEEEGDSLGEDDEDEETDNDSTNDMEDNRSVSRSSSNSTSSEDSVTAKVKKLTQIDDERKMRLLENMSTRMSSELRDVLQNYVTHEETEKEETISKIVDVIMNGHRKSLGMEESGNSVSSNQNQHTQSFTSGQQTHYSMIPYSGQDGSSAVVKRLNSQVMRQPFSYSDSWEPCTSLLVAELRTLGAPQRRALCWGCRSGFNEARVDCKEVDELDKIFSQHMSTSCWEALAISMSDYFDKNIRAVANKIKRPEEKEIPYWSPIDIFDHWYSHSPNPKKSKVMFINQIEELVKGLYNYKAFQRNKSAHHIITVDTEVIDPYCKLLNLWMKMATLNPDKCVGSKNSTTYGTDGTINTGAFYINPQKAYSGGRMRYKPMLTQGGY